MASALNDFATEMSVDGSHCTQGGCSGAAEAKGKPFGSYVPGTEAGENAAQYWADLQVQTGNPLYAFPGSLASMWTPDTAVATGLTLGSAGTVAIANRAGLLWIRAYPNAGGEGLGIDWGGKNVIRFDWHKFKMDGMTVSRPHIDSKPLRLKHWPW